jgi:Ribosomal protein L7/L12 C-terminal domain
MTAAEIASGRAVYEVIAVSALLLSVLALLVAAAAVAGRSGSGARLARLERRTDEIADHVGLPPEPARTAVANVYAPAASANVLMSAGGTEAVQRGAAEPAPTDSAGVLSLLAAGKKINAIKLYRQETGVGLKEAKDAVETMERGMVRP